MTTATRKIGLKSVAGLLLALGLCALEAGAQPGPPPGKVPPQLPPQASDQAQETVQTKTAPTVSLTAPTAGTLYTAPASVLLQATASANSGGKSIAKIEFFAGATLIGTVSSAPYVFTWAPVAAGAYSLTARATDNLGVAATSSAVAILVNAPPTVSLTSPENGVSFAAPAIVALTATAADTDGTIQKVEFFHGGTNLIATVTSAPYTFNWTNVQAGAYSLTAVTTDNQGATATSAPVPITVNALPTISLTSPVNNATFTAPANIPLTAVASDTDGTITSVEFFDGTTLITTRTVAPYSIIWTGVPTGSYNLTARVTDNQGGVTTSAVASVMVNVAVAQIFYIHTDHLNTPRTIYNNQQQLVWRWDQTDPFGGNPPDENPSGLGTFTCNLRLPGQYFDKETNLHYNYYRKYDPGIGRYVQSDPIGLQGGINSYAYSDGNPIQNSDPFGLDVKVCYYPGGITHVGFGAPSSSQTQGFYPKKKQSPRGPGKIDFDPYEETGTQCKVISAKPNQDKCMEDCQLKRSRTPGIYNGLTRNCTFYVRDCLLECGLPAGINVPGPNPFFNSLPGTSFPGPGGNRGLPALSPDAASKDIVDYTYPRTP